MSITNMSKIMKTFVGFFAIFVLLFALGCTQLDDSFPSGEDSNVIDVNTTPQFPDGTNDDFSESDEFFEGEVAATVNDKEILQEDVLLFQQSLEQQGQQVSEQEALEQLINQEVLYQEVNAQGYDVTDEEAESEIENQLAQQGMSLDEYKEQLESQEISYEEQLNSIKEQLNIQNYIGSQISEDDLSVTVEEIQEYYDLYVQEVGEDEVPPLEEIEDQIEMVVQQNKEQELVSFLVQELVENANIKYN
jgi:hypothetical protein